jgi:arylsulfatase A-like enzyme
MALVLLACGKGHKEEAPAVRRLWELSDARLNSTRAYASATVVLREDFEGESLEWARVVDPDHPLRSDPEAFSATVALEGEQRFLTLEGHRGGKFRIQEVDPGGYYEFRGRVRTRQLEPQAEGLFHGATYYLGELERFGSTAEILPHTEELITRHRTLEATSGTTDWDTRSLLFQVGPTTEALLICCVLGLSEEVLSGRVDFDDIELRRVDPRFYWSETCDEQSRARETTAKGWQAHRLIRQALGAESRATIVLLPGEILRFRIAVPSGEPQLSFGAGAWWSEEREVGLRDPVLRVAIEGRVVWKEKQARSDHLHQTRWNDIEISLAPWAEKEIELELSAEEAPAAFGGLLLRDGSARPVGPNLILISIDTLRADHVGSYGYSRGTTPRLDELARTGVRVSDFTAQSPYTLPSHVSMFSGQFPTVHGVFGPTNAIGRDRTPMLAELLSAHGYSTRAFTAGGFVNPGLGFDRGFDAYSNLDPFRYRGSPHAAGLIARRPERYSEELFSEYGVHAIQDWLDKNADKSFFLFLHSYTVHDFDPPPEYLDAQERIDPQPYLHHEYVAEHGITDEVLADIVDYYDAALRHVDHSIGEILDRLDTLGIADRTVVAITSDHGKELGERGLIIHGTTLYEEMTRIPFLLRVPGMAPRVIDEPGMLIDVAPTVLAALGLAVDPRMQGRNLLEQGEHPPRFIWSEIDQLAHKYALRDPSGWKLIHGPPDEDLFFPNEAPWELYSLNDDPGEDRDRSRDESELRTRLEEQLLINLRTMREWGDRLGGSRSSDVDDETTEMLRQLGYIGGPDE